MIRFVLRHHKKDIPFIALIGTAVPSVVGMDIPAAAARIERQLNIPTICIECDGFHSYTEGVSESAFGAGKEDAGKTGVQNERGQSNWIQSFLSWASAAIGRSSRSD